MQSPEKRVLRIMEKTDNAEKVQEYLGETETYLLKQGNLREALPEGDATFLTAAIYYRRKQTITYLGTIIDVTTADLSIALWTQREDIVEQVVDIMTTQGLKYCKKFYKDSVLIHAINSFATLRMKRLLEDVLHNQDIMN